MIDFELENNYLQGVENVLKKIVDKNNSQIEIFNDDYKKSHIDYMDKTTESETRKFLSAHLKQLESSIEYLQNENYRYAKIKYSPYFAKINLTENCENLCYYIGTKNITNYRDEFSVIDWRTPICSLFYNSSLGKTSYIAPMGKIDVTLKSKRQFKIENAKLIDYYDIDSNYCDDMLRDSLNATSTPYMKNIVSTIQSEQDKIIRENQYTSVVVNGIAGSGKTSIGMHRIAYLLYLDRENLTSKNVLIISPNKLFTEYISHLLPELGEENVTTLNIVTIFNNQMKDIGFAREKSILIDDLIAGNELRYSECTTKYGYQFFEKLQNFLSKYNSTDKIIDDIKISNKTLSPEIIKNYYFCPNQMDIKKSIEVTADRITNEFFYQKTNTAQSKIKEQLVSYFYKKVFSDSIIDIYKKFLDLNHLSKNIYDKNDIRFEDMPALLYIKSKLYGIEQNNFIKQIFVDEMQDYDAISIALIKEIFPQANFTMVGDYDQNLIFSESNEKAIGATFNNAKFYNLTTNYRSTSNISKFAYKIVGKTYCSNFIRNGKEPQIIESFNFEENIKQLKAQIKTLQSKYERIAIICKSNEEVKKYAKYLTNCYTLTENKTQIEISKPILTSVFYAKGLEFDAIILPNVSNENYNSTIDKHILYVACTRALQQLNIYYVGQKSPLIEFAETK